MESDALALRRAQLSLRQRQRLQQRLLGHEPAPASITIARRNAVTAPLSSAQKRLWFLQQLHGPDPAYHLGAVLKLSGTLHAHALQAALNTVIARHEALRTVFRINAEGTPEQHILAHEPMQVAFVDLTDIEAERRTLRAEESARAFHDSPFDLEQGPLLRVQWLRLDAEEHWLAIVMHHIVTDAWSKRLIVDEFVTCYNALAAGRTCELPPVVLQYSDYAAWQAQWSATPERTRQLEYWRAQLGGGEADSDAVTQLPADHPRRTNGPRCGGTHCIALSSALDIPRFAQAQQAGVFSVLLAAFFIVLQRYSGQRGVRVGVPVASRHHVETAGVVGCFVNMQVWRCELRPCDTPRTVLARVREMALAAQAHQDLPFEDLVAALQPAASAVPTPLFNVMFNHLKESHAGLRQLRGLELHEYLNLNRGAQFDLALDTTERMDGRLDAVFTFDAGLFEAATVARLARHYRRALEQLIVRPDAPLHGFAMLDTVECGQLQDWGQGPAAHEAGEPLHRWIETRAQTHPEAVALHFRAERLGYRELNLRANRLAHRLIALGVRPESRVGIAVERSIEMVVGLLAIWKAGGAYVPLDPGYPRERLAYMLEDSAIELLLTQEHLRARMPATVRAVMLDTVDLRGEPEHDPQVAVHGESLAYVIYTSGSTGRPKGAANRHRSLYNRIRWMQQAYALAPNDVVLQKTPFGFDVSVWEFFWPLMTGAQLVIAEPDAHRDPGRLLALIRQYHVTTLHFVPSMLQAFLAQPDIERCESLRRIVCSGEALPAEAQNEVLRRLPHASLYNLYGPTEAAIDVTHWTCRDDGRGQVPIGHAIAGIRTCVLDADLNRVPPGVPGELYLGGIGLARGYLHRAALTAERFVADPLSHAGERLYRTGDLVRWSAAGVLEYLGRIDAQVKIRGFRIEPGEIEAQLLAQPEVREAAVIAQPSTDGARLIAYVCAHEQQQLDVPSLRERLQRALPEYMVPAAFVVLAALPVSPNGKLDRKALPAADFTASRTYEAPQGAVEEALAQVWSQVLQVQRVGRHDNFFELGGHSLSATQMIARARRELRAELSVQDVFHHPTLAALAARAAPLHAAAADALLQIDRFMDSLETL